ncbi:MAG: hypothetical protein KY443_01045 [Actinobacteria bacterium]|nr:hypothetical protein [Actinomycetota bacterium]
MAITEESRRQLHRALTGVMGEEGATLVVEHLPPMDWSEVATKRDLADTKTELRAEIHDVRREVAMLRAEMTAGFALVNERFTSVDARFTSIEARLDQHEKLFATKADVLALSVQLHQELRRMTMTLLFAGFGFVSAAAAAAGLVVGT